MINHGPNPGAPISLEDLVAEIESAFKDVSRENGVSLHQTTVFDDMGTEDEKQAAFKMDHDQHWTEISDQDIEQFSDALAFFDVIGWVYHVPAFLRWTLLHGKASASLSSDSTLYTLDPPDKHHKYKGILYHYHKSRIDALSDSQRRVCARFLRYMGWQQNYDEAREYYQQYWKQFKD